MGKRPSFAEVATNGMRFLADEHGFAGLEVARGRIPGITHISYSRSDMTIEIIHVVGFMGENYVETRYRLTGAGDDGAWTPLGTNTTHTGYQLRRAVDLQAQAIRSRLGRPRHPAY